MLLPTNLSVLLTSPYTSFGFGKDARSAVLAINAKPFKCNLVLSVRDVLGTSNCQNFIHGSCLHRRFVAIELFAL